MEFIIPEEITLAGSRIAVRFNEDLDVIDRMGVWSPSQNEISIGTHVAPSVQFEAFCHELAEAIASKFVNEDEGEDSTDVPHRLIDAYGRGIFNFLIENTGRITKIE